MNKVPFRVKDKITGLYYCPSRKINIKDSNGYGRKVKSNLSKKGKIYFIDPRNHIKQFYDHTRVVIETPENSFSIIKNLQLRDYVENEWELENL